MGVSMKQFSRRNNAPAKKDSNSKRKGSNGQSRHHSNNSSKAASPASAREKQKKFLALAKDAISAGHRVEAESYYQYAEHYYRLAAAFSVSEQSEAELKQKNIS